jgi:hypothetical protein
MIGAGRNRKSMACVENAATAIEWTLQLSPGEYCYNYGDEPARTVLELVATALFHVPVSAARAKKFTEEIVFSAE